MNFDYSKFKIEFYQPIENNSFTEIYITYNACEAIILFNKINFTNEFIDIVKANNGFFDTNDCFRNENDAQSTIFELQEIFKDENYSNFLIKNAIINYINKENINILIEKEKNQIYKYYSMLDKKYIDFLLNLNN